MEINIYWNDLTPEKQRDIADLMGMATVSQAIQTTWELMPMAVVEIGEDGKGERSQPHSYLDPR